MRTPGPLGLWIETEWADVVVFQRETTQLHQDHIILHEIGHILADHRGLVVEADHWADMLPGLRAGAILRVLQRCTYGTDEENEAELVATIICEWASVLDQVTPTLDEGDAATQRVVSALGDHRGWL
ncbi:hypothetical protein ACFVTY_08975 [Streptomyces sp. NPDC058067]|uniref:hypothetical protein n=1 Tax=Streptomyces sp. NPDC058067 TaxID=3346324 RepID=UPI0036ECD778